VIRIEGLSRSWGTFRIRVERLSVPEGAHLALLGPCGAGKTLLLETVAGHYLLDGGEIHVGGRRVDRLPPERRGIGMIYQNIALFPHMSVARNIAFGLRYKRLGRAERNGRVARIAERVGVTGLLGVADVGRLSGGESQKVALARTLVTEPKALLLDEPLHSLDRPSREEMLSLILDVTREIGTTVIHVTHDFAEASAAAEQCAVILAGELKQQGATRDVFSRPVDRAVAAFLGVANIWRLRRDRDEVKLLGRRVSLPVPRDAAFACARPESLLVGPAAGDAELTFAGSLRKISDRTDYVRVVLDCSGEDVVAHVGRSHAGLAGVSPGEAAPFGFARDAVHFLPDDPRENPSA